MRLAGRFAEAIHRDIHRRVAGLAGLKEATFVENHPNFAWRETLLDGVSESDHLQDAPPAGTGILGVIPGSMSRTGNVVCGRGARCALRSASHSGAGRAMSRKDALGSITRTMCAKYLRERGIAPLDSSLDDQSQTCKDVETVTAAQNDPAEIFGKFTPRMVRMADEAGAIDDLAEASRAWRGYASGRVIHRTSPLY